jgi:hypothetical protein
MRKEELYDMESRAENLERRILEGVMDHSRVLLMSKAKRSGSDAMSRKRVRKPAEEDSQDGRKSMVGMALNAKRNLAAPSPTGAGRRIVSLSQINNNVATGGVKRSQSVRTPTGGGGKVYRKRSWGGGLNMADNDKENSVNETVEEVDEADVKPGMTSETVEVPDEETIVLEQEINAGAP